MAEFVETAMLLAAMDEDDETLDRFAVDMTAVERHCLRQALDRVRTALNAADRVTGSRL